MTGLLLILAAAAAPQSAAPVATGAVRAVGVVTARVVSGERISLQGRPDVQKRAGRQVRRGLIEFE